MFMDKYEQIPERIVILKGRVRIQYILFLLIVINNSCVKIANSKSRLLSSHAVVHILRSKEIVPIQIAYPPDDLLPDEKRTS